MNKENIIVLSAVLILLIAMFSYNSFPDNYLSSDLSVTGKATTTFEKCSIRQAGWSSSPDSLQKITQIKQGQTVYMYISTNNCAGEEITFELYRLKKRFLLKDSLVLIASSTKTVSSSSKLSAPVVASINTEDGSSSNYRFRVRLTKYLPATNTTNTTLPPPPTTNTTTPPPTTNITGLPDLIVEKLEFVKYNYLGPQSPGEYVLIEGDSINLGEVQPYARITTKNIGAAFDIYPSSTLTTGIITKDGTKIASFYGGTWKMGAGQYSSFPWGFNAETVGKYCIEQVAADSTKAINYVYGKDNILKESNENNNIYSGSKCLIVKLSSSSLPDITLVNNGFKYFWARGIRTYVNDGGTVPVNTVIETGIDVINNGNAISYFGAGQVRFVITKDGSVINDYLSGELSVINLGPSSVVTIHPEFTVSGTGNYCFNLINLDKNNEITELNENNNVFNNYGCIYLQAGSSGSPTNSS